MILWFFCWSMIESPVFYERCNLLLSSDDMDFDWISDGLNDSVDATNAFADWPVFTLNTNWIFHSARVCVDMLYSITRRHALSRYALSSTNNKRPPLPTYLVAIECNENALCSVVEETYQNRLWPLSKLNLLLWCILLSQILVRLSLIPTFFVPVHLDGSTRASFWKLLKLWPECFTRSRLGTVSRRKCTQELPALNLLLYKMSNSEGALKFFKKHRNTRGRQIQTALSRCHLKENNLYECMWTWYLKVL